MLLPDTPITPTLPPRGEPSLAPASIGPPESVPLRVIIAEDDNGSRKGLEKAVRFLGHECRSARDGLEAWEMHQAEHADVILSDWKMPRMDGLELCQRTRVSEIEGAYTYFIFMTGFADKEHFLRGMEAGADDYHAKPIDLDELHARLVAASRVVALHRTLAEKNVSLRRDSQASFLMARVDPLTKVANRLRMNEDLEVVWSNAKRYKHRYSTAICDIDDFKKYNDHFGHLAGDETLRRVAHAIRDELRQGDGLYRYGGEEFVVTLPEQSLAEATRALDRVRVAVGGLAIPTVTAKGVVTISIGVAELDVLVDATLEGWLSRADTALYRAKAGGRNRVAA